MVGIDEVGRGAWAGPLLVVAARLRRGQIMPAGVRDSKKLSKKKREQLAAEIVEVCDIGDGWVSAEVIDRLGLTKALKSACLLAALKLDAKASERIILDGTVDYFKDSHYKKVEVIAKADDSVPIVSAASIVAKVMRDQLMCDVAEQYPAFGFKSHVGYGTKSHKDALEAYGVTAEHRRSFAPVKKLIDERYQQ